MILLYYNNTFANIVINQAFKSWHSQSRGLGCWRVALPPANTPKSPFSPALGRESDTCFAGLSDFEKAIAFKSGSTPNPTTLG
jgi:hypothetical protein